MVLLSNRLRQVQGSDTDSVYDSDMENKLNVEEGEDDEIEEEEEEEDGEEEEEEQFAEQKNDEIEELEKEYMNLRHNEQDLLKNLKRHKDEDFLKGQAIKNQKVLWDKTLEFKFLLQRLFEFSNRLPQEPVRSSFCDSDNGVGVAYSDLITSSEKTLDSMLELQEALLENNPSIIQATDGNSLQSFNHSEASKNQDVDDDERWFHLSQMHTRIAPFRNKSIDKWHRKTQVTTGAAAIKSKLNAFNQDVSQQIAYFMRDPSKMIKQMQRRRSTINIFGAVPEVVGNIEDVDADGDPELLDDEVFHRKLVAEFLETVDATSSAAALYGFKKLQTKKRKIVDRRASKSRKIRYNVHEKIVNFMAPQPMNLPPMTPQLFSNLFGLKTQNTD